MSNTIIPMPQLTVSGAYTLFRWGVNPLSLNEAYLHLPLATSLPALALTQLRTLPVKKACSDPRVQLAAACGAWTVWAERTGRIRIPVSARYFGLVFVGTISAGVLASAYLAAKYYFRKRAPDDVETLVFDALCAVDAGGSSFSEADQALAQGDGAEAKKKRRFHFLPYLVRSIKSDSPLPQDNAANRMVVRKKVVNFANKHGIRPHHTQEFVDLAIDLILTPTRKDIESAQFKKTTTVTLRDAEYAYWGGRKAVL